MCVCVFISVKQGQKSAIRFQIPLLVAFKAKLVNHKDKYPPQINIWLCSVTLSECFSAVYTNSDLREKRVRHKALVPKMQNNDVMT